MIKFKKIRYKNFFSVGNSFASFNLNKVPNTLIVGKSGEGKSTLIDALTFALFGRAYRDLNKKQLVNSINKKGLLVELAFDDYVIRRGIGPNVFEIYKNKELIEQKADVREYQKYLEKDILKMNFKTFSQIIVLGSASFTPFMKLTPVNRRDVIEELLDLHIFSTMGSIITNNMDEVKRDLSKINTQVEVLKSTIRTLEDVIKRQDSSKDFSNIEENIKNKKQEIAEHEVEVAKLTKIKDKIKSKIDKFPATHTDIQSKLKMYTKKITELNTEINLLLKTNNFLDDNDNCPVCKQGIEISHKSDIKSNSTKVILDLESSIELSKEKQKKVNDILTKLTDLEDKYDDIKKNIAIIHNSISIAENSISRDEDKIEILSKNVENENISTTELDNAKSEITKYNKKYEEVKTDLNNLKICKDILKDSGIKTVIISKYIPLLNASINKYLEQFDLFVSFELDAEFNETIKSRHRDAFSYNSFSEGEKRRIDFSILLAFRDIAYKRNSISTNVLIIDELLDGLDDDNKENLEEIMKCFKDTNTIFISHSEEIKNKDIFNVTFKTQKISGFTHYEEV